MLSEQTITHAQLPAFAEPFTETPDDYRDEPFDWNRRPHSEAARQLAAEAFEAAEERRRTHPNTRALSAARKEAGLDAVGCLLAHPIIKHLSGVRGGLTITRSKRLLDSPDRHRPALMKASTIEWLDRLVATGFLVEDRGEQGQGDNNKRTRIAAGARLQAAIREYGLTVEDIGQSPVSDVLFLRSADIGWNKRGPRIEYTETAQTEALRRQVVEINAHLRAADIATSAAWQGRLDIQNRNLRRSFTEGSFECGGRFGGGFWMQMPKADRFEALRINGEPVVELDFASMYPRMAYGLVGAEVPEADPYVIDRIGPEYRRGVKLLLNAMLWARGPLKRFPRGAKDLMPPKARVTEIATLIINQHQPLQPLIGARVGPRLMFMESTIMTETLLELASAGIAALPVHDALLVARSHAEIARTTMLAAFERIAGVPGRVTLSMRPEAI